MNPESVFLIAMGWRPAPTINEFTAWEHPVLSIALRSAAPDVYCPGRVRWVKPVATGITVHLEAMMQRLEAAQASVLE